MHPIEKRSKEYMHSLIKEIFDEIDNLVPLRQGDTLAKCPYIYPIPIPELSDGVTTLPAWVQRFNVVVLSHSCDLEHSKTELVLLIPIWEITDYVKTCCERLRDDKEYCARFVSKKKFEEKIVNEFIKNATTDKLQGYTVIKGAPPSEKYPEGTEPWLVDFTNAYSLPCDYVDNFALMDANNSKRLRLRPDYRIDLVCKFSYFLQRGVLPSKALDYDKVIKPITNELKVMELLVGVNLPEESPPKPKSDTSSP